MVSLQTKLLFDQECPLTTPSVGLDMVWLLVFQQVGVFGIRAERSGNVEFQCFSNFLVPKKISTFLLKLAHELRNASSLMMKEGHATHSAKEWQSG